MTTPPPYPQQDPNLPQPGPYPGQYGNPTPPPYPAAYPGAAGYPAYPGGSTNYPGGPGQPAPASPPPTVNGAFWVWVLSAVVTLVSAVLVLMSDDFEQAMADAAASDPVMRAALSGTRVLVISFGVLFAALYIFFAVKMRAGRNWARITLTVLGALGVLSSFTTGQSVTGVDGTTYQVGGGWTVWLGAAIAAVGLILMWLPESNKYFAAFRAPKY